MPGPINSHRCRSRAVAFTRRGYHSRGTDTLRPSRNSTVKVRFVTRTFRATAGSFASMKVLMPSPYQFAFVPPRNLLDALQLRGREPVVVSDSSRCQPELRCLALAAHVHVHRLVPITRKKEEAIRTALQNSRTHELLSQVFRNGPNEQRATRMIRLTFGAHPRPLLSFAPSAPARVGRRCCPKNTGSGLQVCLVFTPSTANRLL
jgi:hypothetical protein